MSIDEPFPKEGGAMLNASVKLPLVGWKRAVSEVADIWTAMNPCVGLGLLEPIVDTK
jgi:hypothetical protein